MSTRAVFTFVDDMDAYHVYKHHDGYPEGVDCGALHAIKSAFAYAWPWPRFEADEFAAAFVAANKPLAGGGDVRLLRAGAASWRKAAPTDIEYRYQIRRGKYGVLVRGYAVEYDYGTGRWTETLVGDWTVTPIVAGGSV